MIIRLICGLALSLGCAASASSAAAKDCAPLKTLASMKLTSLPDYRQMISVTINGSAKQFILDTGGIYTQIAPGAASTLHLARQAGATPIFDASRNVSGSFVKIDSFELGGMEAKDLYLRVSPSDLGADGLIAPDLLNRYDVEMDFAGGKMNYFLPDHCPGKVVYWPHGDVAQVGLVLADKRWIKVPVTLDGQSLLAVIDTGATVTTITTQKAQEAFGLTPNSPGMGPAGNVNGDPNLASYAHTFSSLSLDGITIKNLRVIVMPDRVSDTGPRYRYWLADGKIYSQKRLEMPDLILGMDVLKHLRLYFDFKYHDLYATEAQVPVVPVRDTPAKKLTPPVLVALREAQEAYRKKDYPAALAAVAKARAIADLPPYDLLFINRTATSVHVATSDFDAAEVDAEAAADTDASVIPDADKTMVYRAALLLSLKAKHYDKAAGYARLYQAANPPASDQALIQTALSHAGDKAGAASEAAPAKAEAGAK